MAWGSGSVGRLRGGRRACGAVRAACWVEGQVFDVHDPLDATDGIDVDVPQAISGLPPSQIATAGGITYVSNPVTRPAADAFFAAWGARRRERHQHALDLARPEPPAGADRLPRPQPRRLCRHG